MGGLPRQRPAHPRRVSGAMSGCNCNGCDVCNPPTPRDLLEDLLNEMTTEMHSIETRILAEHNPFKKRRLEGTLDAITRWAQRVREIQRDFTIRGG